MHHHRDKKYWFLFVLCFLFGCQKNIEVVSLIKILNDAERYDGTQIIVAGYLSWRFESRALYLTKEHADFGITESAIWVNVPADGFEMTDLQNQVGSESKLEEFNGRYVRMVGTFKSHERSSDGEFAGEVLVRKIRLL